jgi:hypothetical protein
MVTRRFGRVRAAPGAALAMAVFATPAAAVDVTVGGNT